MILAGKFNYRVARNFWGSLVLPLAIFRVLRELIFAVITDSVVFLAGNYFLRFSKYSVSSSDNIFVFVKYMQ